MNNTENKKREKNLIIMIIICIICIILVIAFMSYIYIESTNKLLDSTPANETKKMIFYDVTFIKNVKDSNVELLDNNLILSNKLIYNTDNKVIEFDGSNYDSIKYTFGYYIVEKDKKFGILDSNFKTIIPIQYNEIEIPSKNTAILTNIINTKSIKEIVNLNNMNNYGTFTNLKYLYDNFIIGDKYLGNINDISDDNYENNVEKHLINITDNKDTLSNLNDYSFTLAEKFQDKYIILDKLINNQYKFGVIDINNNNILDFKYDKIENINDKLLLIESNNKYGLIDINKNNILSFDSYNDIFIVNDIISIEDKTTKYYDFLGNLLYETENDSYIEYIGDNYYLLRDFNNLCVYFNNKEKTNKQIDYSYCDAVMNTNINGYLYKKENDKYLLYDNKLKKVLNQEYNSISLSNNYFIGEIDKKYYILDFNGNKLIDKTFIDYKLTEDSGYILEDEDNNLYYFKY